MFKHIKQFKIDTRAIVPVSYMAYGPYAFQNIKLTTVVANF